MAHGLPFLFQCTDDVIGGVMSVLARRRGQIVEEVHSPDSPLCLIRAHMPVNEGFGEHLAYFTFPVGVNDTVKQVLWGWRGRREF